MKNLDLAAVVVVLVAAVVAVGIVAVVREDQVEKTDIELEAEAERVLQEQIESDPAAYWDAYYWCAANSNYYRSDEIHSAYSRIRGEPFPGGFVGSVGCGDGWNLREPRVPDPNA